MMRAAVKLLALVSVLMFAFVPLKAQLPDKTAIGTIPIDFTLTEILRVNVISGGNIEFVFNSMSQYKNGIPNTGFYNTDIVIASSTDWELNFGAEDLDLLPTDDPTHGARQPAAQVGILLNNIGYLITPTGTIGIASGGTAPTGLGDDSDVAFNGLGQFGVTPSQNPLMDAALGDGSGNGGDVTENAFTISWQCGIVGATGAYPTNGTSLLSQSIQPDRYVTNVLIDINSK